MLEWAAVQGGAGPHERKLRDLALLSLRDPLEERERAATGDDGMRDLNRDLFRQIQDVFPQQKRGKDDAPTETFLQAVEELLAVGAQADERPHRPTRLDVIVLSRPQGSGDLGRLRTVLDQIMDALGDHPELRSRSQGGHRLSMIQLLDFENYWSRAPEASELRRALRDSLEYWEQRYQDKRPSFARTYVMDGHAEDRGHWIESSREEEAVLLLQFMLFEGHRSGDLGRLFARSQDRASPVGAIGIRQIERSSGLMGRLAAARFGVKWMDYLAGEHGREGTAPARWADFKQKLRRWHPSQLEQMVRSSQARRQAETSLEELSGRLLAVDIHEDDWVDRVVDMARRELRDLRRQITGWASRRVQEIDEEQLRALPGDVESAVEQALHDDKNPLTLADVTRDLEQLRDELEPVPLPELQPGDEDALQDHFRKVHRDHRRFAEEQLDPGRSPRWWILLAFVIAAGMTPLLSGYLQDLTKPEPTAAMLLRLHAAAQWFSEPLFCGLAVLAVLIVLGLYVQRGVAYRVTRAHRFWDDARRGRFANAVLGATGPGGLIRTEVDRAVDTSVREAQWRVVSEVRRTLELVLSRLGARHREIRWLRQQLVDFQMEYGIDEQTPQDDTPLFGKTKGPVRYRVERTADYRNMLEFFPADGPRFRAMQSSERPFQQWSEEFSPAFLNPLVFLDHLGKKYTDPYETERARQDDGPMHARHAEQFKDFLDHYGRFATGFQWPRRVVVVHGELWAVVPARWKHYGPIRDVLVGTYAQDHILDGRNVERAFLLHVDLGARPEHMVEEELR